VTKERRAEEDERSGEAHAQESQSILVERGSAEANQWGTGRVPARGDPAELQDAMLQGPAL
jgi:hypothetical protein